jgi:hypothetical protein
MTHKSKRKLYTYTPNHLQEIYFYDPAYAALDRLDGSILLVEFKRLAIEEGKLLQGLDGVVQMGLQDE